MQLLTPKTEAIIEMLQDCDFQVLFERDGAAQKKHTLLGVVVMYKDNASQAVCPCYNDMEYDLNSIEIRGGKPVVTQKVIAKGNSKGLQWFETFSDNYTGSMVQFLSTEEVCANIVYTPPPMPEPVIVVTVKGEVEVDVDVAANGKTVEGERVA